MTLPTRMSRAGAAAFVAFTLTACKGTPAPAPKDPPAQSPAIVASYGGPPMPAADPSASCAPSSSAPGGSTL